MTRRLTRQRSAFQFYGLDKLDDARKLGQVVSRMQQQRDRDGRSARNNVANDSVTKTVTIPDSAAAPNTVKIVHGLGRKPAGYNVARVVSGGPPAFNETSRDASQLTLTGAGTTGIPTVVELRIY